MKTVNINFVCLILIAFVISCDKSERYDDPEPIDSISTFRLEISLNGTPYKDYLFTTDEILEENIFTQDSKTKKVKYSWNDFRSIQRKDYYDQPKNYCSVSKRSFNMHLGQQFEPKLYARLFFTQ